MIFTRTPCVLVMSTDVLLKRAFAHLLTIGEDVQIVVSEAENVQELIEDIGKTNPDAVLFSESISFSRMESLSRLLMLNPMPRLIVASENRNALSIFSKEEKAVMNLNDLLTFINAP